MAEFHPQPRLRLENVSKTFGATKALDEVSFDIAPGEIHALVGTNGSGKSTLVKILAGYHRADPRSSAELNGVPIALVSERRGAPRDDMRFVHQDLGLVLQLDALDNLALVHGYRRKRSRRIDWDAERANIKAVFARFDLDVDPGAPLTTFAPVERVVLAIASTLHGWESTAGLLVLDEPTAVLPPQEVGRLFAILREIRLTGTSILYVSHRLDEVFDLADRVSVLRDSRYVTTAATDSLDVPSLARLMLGQAGAETKRAEQAHTELIAADATAEARATVLACRDLHGRYLAGVDFAVHEGEILGVAGLLGDGVRELPYLLAGAETKQASGEIRVGTESQPSVPVAASRRTRLPFVPGDREAEGVIAGFSVQENLSLSILGTLRSGIGLDGNAERRTATQWLERFAVRTTSGAQPITTLSGGNQQKVVMARCLATDSPVIVLCEPTAGVDIGARQSIHEAILEESRAGRSFVIASADIDDLLGVSTRIIVLRDGRVAEQLSGTQIEKSNLLEIIERREDTDA